MNVQQTVANCPHQTISCRSFLQLRFALLQCQYCKLLHLIFAFGNNRNNNYIYCAIMYLTEKVNYKKIIANKNCMLVVSYASIVGHSSGSRALVICSFNYESKFQHERKTFWGCRRTEIKVIERVKKRKIIHSFSRRFTQWN